MLLSNAIMYSAVKNIASFVSHSWDVLREKKTWDKQRVI